MTRASGVSAYHLLKAAIALFERTPAKLNEDELTQAKAQAGNTLDLESRMLSSREAVGLSVPNKSVQEGIKEIESRYENRDDFLKDLAVNDLSLDSLKAAIQRDLWCELVLDRVALNAAPVTEEEIIKAYEINKAHLIKPETREVRHILMTINPEFEDNTRERATERLQALADELGQNPGTDVFADTATKNSECPSALNGGILGDLPKGTMFAEIDAFAFTAEEGAVSPIIETEAGLHLIYVEAIHPGGPAPFEEAAPKLKEAIEDRRAKACQRDWLNTLKAAAPAAKETYHA